jgi:hypothetical protein
LGSIEPPAAPTHSWVSAWSELRGFVGALDIRVERQAETFPAAVVFIDTEIPVLLGQEAFFDRYRIKFEKDHDTFEITPAPRR